METKDCEKNVWRGKKEMSRKMKGEKSEDLLFNFGVVFEALIRLRKTRKQRKKMNNNS